MGDAEEPPRTFPEGTAFEVILADDANLDVDGGEPETLQEMATRGFAAMLQYPRNLYVNFLVRTTMPDGSPTEEHNVVVPSNRLWPLIEEAYGALGQEHTGD